MLTCLGVLAGTTGQARAATCAVDQAAPGAADTNPGTEAKACAIAQPGETIVLRGGVYREALAPKNDGVTVCAMAGAVNP